MQQISGIPSAGIPSARRLKVTATRERTLTEWHEAKARNEQQIVRNRLVTKLHARETELAGVAAQLESERASGTQCRLSEDDLRREVARCHVQHEQMNEDAQMRFLRQIG